MILPPYCTSTESALHVESPWIVYEVFRPGFFRPIVQLANTFANDEIEASGVRKRGISSVDVSSDGTHTPVPAYPYQC